MKSSLIVCPLDVEMKFLMEGFKGQNLSIKKEPEGLKLPVFYIKSLNSFLSVSGHGKIQTAIHTSYLIEKLDVDQVILAGSCGALEDGLEVFDVVLGSETVEHDVTYKFTTRPLPTYKAHPDFTKAAESCGLIQVKIASGDEDVVDRDRAYEIQKKTLGCSVVAWEGAGAAKACRFKKIPFAELRAVTDLCKHSDLEAFGKTLPKAMEKLSVSLVSLLKHTTSDFC